MRISRRERQVLTDMSYGYTIKEIADRLCLSPHTIISHRKNLYEKLDAKNAPSLIRLGFQLGILNVVTECHKPQAYNNGLLSTPPDDLTCHL